MSPLFQSVLAGKVVCITAAAPASQTEAQTVKARNAGSSLLVPVLSQSVAQQGAR